MSPLINKALDPFIQILKRSRRWPGCAGALHHQGFRAVRDFCHFICSVWPMLLNTAFGVARAQGMDQRRPHARGRHRQARFTVILPGGANNSHGMRISIGIAWLVIVAAEMLVGGTGIGYFV